jgi:allantoicase
MERMTLREPLPQVPLRPGSQELFAAERGEPVTHARSSLYPKTGVSAA